MNDPFADFLAALDDDPAASDDRVRIDPNRVHRTGVPEVVYAARKSSADVILALRALADANGRALASRLTDEHLTGLTAPDGYDLTIDEDARIAILAIADAPPLTTREGRIAVITAGTSDRKVGREAALMAREMGCDVIEIHDVGVAGLHRMVAPLRHAIAEGVDAIIVAAGMDGALPTVIAGLVEMPVIGLPVSTGYGAGGDGMAALMTMLQSCAPGLAVVNIDNGIGAGSLAALISRRARDPGKKLPE